MPMPLEGIRVLDMTHLAPASFSSMFLGDMGADVIKIQPPRSIIPFRLGHVGLDEEKWAAYEPTDRNKRSISLDLRKEEARQIVYKLAERADVFMEGFRPGVVERMGVDYETLNKINPRLVYCSQSGYGHSGPYADQVGHDINYISTAGILSVIGVRGGEPIIPSNLIADFAGAGLHGVIGVLLALMARERTGKGQYVDITYLDGSLSLMAWQIAMYLCTGEEPKRGSTWLTGAAPFYNVYLTKDNKYISIGCTEPHFWANLCRALGHEEYIPYQHEGGKKREEIFAAFREIFRTKTRDEWYDYLGKEICVGKVYDLSEVVADPQIQHRNMILEVEHPKYGKVKHPGIPIKLSDTPGQIRRTAPLVGEHNDEILADIGYSKEEIERLRQSGVPG
ncbi:MAG TPA: CoA transferase [Dehalococcoidia bacterium]|nr:CoA transferase [Dehalococcoidia bacterium]